jgi:hypothetical protein
MTSSNVRLADSSNRRSFIGGSDARVIMGHDVAPVARSHCFQSTFRGSGDRTDRRDWVWRPSQNHRGPWRDGGPGDRCCPPPGNGVDA